MIYVVCMYVSCVGAIMILAQLKKRRENHFHPRAFINSNFMLKQKIQWKIIAIISAL